MNTKTCEGCGWVFPITYNEARCRFCGTRFKYRICSVCGEYKELMFDRTECRECHNSLRKVFDPRYFYRDDPVVRKAEQDYKDWLALIASVPTPVKMLTQDQWLEACRYFGKCALCNSENIDTRGFFIPFKLGGRYTAWNILPVCELCANDMRRQLNPFITYNGPLHRKWNHPTKPAIRNNYKADNLEKAVAYLKPKLEEAAQHGKT